MKNRFKVTGAAPAWIGDYSRFRFDDTEHYEMVLNEQGVPILDNELAEAQEMQRTALRKALSYILGDGSPDNGFKIVASSSPVNNFTVTGPGRILIDGWLIDLAASFDYTDQAGLAALTPPVAGTRTDEVYAELWFSEISELENAAIVDPTLNRRTSCRLGMNYVVKVAQGGSTPASGNGGGDVYYWRYKLATILRTTSTSITSGMITDTRRVVSPLFPNDTQTVTHKTIGNTNVVAPDAISPQGTGSGLDADKLDGLHMGDFWKTASSYLETYRMTFPADQNGHLLQVQWSIYAPFTPTDQSQVSYDFPFAFPTACLMVILGKAHSGYPQASVGLVSKTASGFTAAIEKWGARTGTISVCMVAIGY